MDRYNMRNFVIVIVSVGIASVLYFLTQSSIFPNLKKEDVFKNYSSNNGKFSIDLPSDVVMFERPETTMDGGYVRGEVWFVFGEFNEENPRGLVVTYGKPSIEGKGGACIDENGESMYSSEVIAGQDVSVCDTDRTFKAEYFIHPSDQIEYGIYVNETAKERIQLLKEAIRSSFTFN